MSDTFDPSGPTAPAQEGSGGTYPTSFGRGWIPVERDLGLPGERVGALSDEVGPTGAASPLPHAGGAGGGAAASGDDALSGGEGPTPNPTRGREGLHASPINHNAWTPARKAAFLHHLAEKGNVRSAAARVGLSHQSAYVARRCRSWEREGDGPRIMFLFRSKSIFLHVACVI
jgi:hypothetical protein